MEYYIVQESRHYYEAIRELLIAAFADAEHSDHQEHLLVERIRQSAAYQPKLTLCVHMDEAVVGFVMLSDIAIVDGDHSHAALALAPIAVHPEWQNEGIGSNLMKVAHDFALEQGHKRIVLLGHEGYYPRFGYERASKYGVRLPFDVPDENAMVYSLVPDAFEGVKGEVRYPKAFFG